MKTEGSRTIAIRRRAERRKLAARLEDALAAGRDPGTIAADEGSTPGAIARRMFRHGRGDLAGPFERLARRKRRGT